MPKKEYNKIKSLTLAEISSYYNIDINDFHFDVSKHTTKLYDLGEVIKFAEPKKSKKTFFKKNELIEMYDDVDLYIINKEFLYSIIEAYKNQIKNYYNDMVLPLLSDDSKLLDTAKSIYEFNQTKHEFDFSNITSDEQTALYKIIRHVRSLRTEWVDLDIFNLEDGDSITSSWKFEYAIFELVRIYKSFDWKKDIMIYHCY